jgi:hypothetical protein
MAKTFSLGWRGRVAEKRTCQVDNSGIIYDQNPDRIGAPSAKIGCVSAIEAYNRPII